MQRSCFVLTPFSSPFNEYYQEVIAPAIRTAGLEPLRADGIYGTGPIIDDIVDGIKSAVAVVADVTGRNPNVNYELGLAHAFGRPVVIISQSLDDIPFDYRHVRAIIYDTRLPTWTEQLRIKIIASLEGCRPLRLGSCNEEIGSIDKEREKVVLVPVPVSTAQSSDGNDSTFESNESAQYGSYYASPIFPVRGLHHINLPVRNLDASMGFYYETLCLRQATDPEINDLGKARPNFGFPGAWFEFPDGQQLHLVQYDEAKDAPVTFRNSDKINFKDVHFAVRVQDYEAMRTHLIRRKVEIVEGPLRNQCYVSDPDSHIIEITGFNGPGPKKS